MFKSVEEALESFLSIGSSTACFYIVAHYQQMVFGICFKILRNKSEAEEAAQDSFIKFFESLATLDDKTKARYWLLSISYRTAIDYTRKKKIKTLELDSVPIETYSQQTDLYKTIETKDRIKILQQIFDSIGETEGVILSLFYIEDVPVKEIAEITGLTVSNVKIKLMRSRQMLKDQLTLFLEK